MGCTLGNHIPFLTPLIRSKLYTMDNGKFSISIDAKDLSSLLLFHNIHYGDVCLFVLLLYVPGQQLWSLRGGQFT